MAELTLPFWLASAKLSPTEPVLDWLKSIHVQPRWLDEIDIVSPLEKAQFASLTGMAESCLIKKEMNFHSSQHAFLHDACRKIIVGDRQLILLLAESVSGTTAILLSSPSVVGMYNMIPLAYVDTRLEMRLPADADILALLQSALTKAEKPVEKLNYLVVDAGPLKKPAKTDTAFNHAAWVKPLDQPPSALNDCHELVTTMTAAKKKQGLAAEITDNLTLFATWIEGV